MSDQTSARATALLDNLGRDVRYAFRSFRRAPLVALTIVTTIGLGLGLVKVVFTLLNAFIFRVDEVRNPDELFAVERQPAANAEPRRFTRAEYDALVRETSVFSTAFAFGQDFSRWLDGQRMEGTAVTGNFFHMLGVNAARGRTLTPSDDEAASPVPIVLSHRAWSRYFSGDPAVLGRIVQAHGAAFQVVGVMPEGFRGLTVFPPDFWAPLTLAAEAGRVQTEAEEDLGIIGRLRAGVSQGQALAQLAAWDLRRAAERSADRRSSNLVLRPSRGTVPLSLEVMLMFAPLFFAFALVLMIGCANVANLLLARAVARQREIGIRLAVGASRRRIIWQLLTESLLLALVSAVLAFGISRLALGIAIYTITSTWTNFGDIRVVVPPADWRVAVFLFGGAIAATLVFALAPALQATRVDLVRAIRGEVVRDARPARPRNVLVTLQVTGSVLLLICSAIFLRSAWAATAIDSGIRTHDVIMMGIANEPKRAAMLDAVRREPLVASISASWPGGLGGRSAVAETSAPRSGGDRAKPVARSSVTYQLVSPEYFSVLGIDIVRGRGFSPAERNVNAAVAVVSERVARELWPGLDAVGQVLRLAPDENSKKLEPDDPPLPSRGVVVVGIARDVAGFRLANVKLAGAGVYMPIDIQAARTALALRVHGDPDRARRTLIERLSAIDPDPGEVMTLRTMAGLEAYLLAIPFWLMLVLGTLALFLTLSGLFGVLSYLVEQRTREIGVRMALGATRGSIGALVLSQSARPVGIGVLIGCTLTVGLAAALLASPAAELIGSSVRLFDPIAYAGSLLCIIAACACASLIPALRAGRINPVAALRQL
jgi:predicted permease